MQFAAHALAGVGSTTVQVGMSTSTGPRTGRYTQFVAIEGDAPVFGTHLSMEDGVLKLPVGSERWISAQTGARDFTEDPAKAQRVALAVHDAYRAFLQLGIVPNTGAPNFIDRADHLTIESVQGRWTFPTATAPAAARAVYEAALGAVE